MADYITILGLIAGTLTTIALFPQLTKIYKSKSAKDISLPTFIITATGMFLWFVYGIYINAWPVILANLISFILASTISVLKIKYK